MPLPALLGPIILALLAVTNLLGMILQPPIIVAITVALVLEWDTECMTVTNEHIPVSIRYYLLIKLIIVLIYVSLAEVMPSDWVPPSHIAIVCGRSSWLTKNLRVG